MSLYAQHGYGKSSKIDEGIENGLLEGVILSPKNESPDKLADYISHLCHDYKNIDVLLDPQLYVAAFEGAKKQGHLLEYSYYPRTDISKGQLSIPKNISDIVGSAIGYQRDLGVTRLIAPTILVNSFDSRWSQIALSMANEAIEQVGDAASGLILTLCIDESAFKSLELVKDYLDTISLFDVKGFYILIDRDSVDDPSNIESETLKNIMYFCYNLASINGFEVLLGYTELIGLPLYCTGVSGIASGWHNTLRRFSRTDYIPRTGGRQPNRRYLSSPLLTRFLINPEIIMINQDGYLDDVLSDTRYDQFLLSDLSGGQWSSQVNCLHNWEVIKAFMGQLDTFDSVQGKITYFTQVCRDGVLLGRQIKENVFNGDGARFSHIATWDKTLTEFQELIK